MYINSMDEIVIYSDGGSRGNPGPAASAFVVTKNDQVIFSQSRYLGETTNNVAEYTTVLMIVEWLAKNMSDSVLVNLDSQLVERQLNGQYKVKDQKLKDIFLKIKDVILKNKINIKFIWNYRETNHLADELVNKELDANSSTGK